MRLDDKQLLAAMARLKRDSDFRRFVEHYLAGVEREHMETCIQSDNPIRAQGAVQVIQQIKKDIEGAEEAFYRLENNREIPLP